MTPDGELLRRYAETGSEPAFAELVRRHLNLVYSAALRQVNGNAHLAQDVAQAVFTDLARKAASLANRPVLMGWLYTSTHFAAAKAVRTERRRRIHEQEAHTMQELLTNSAPDQDWTRLQPVLDGVMHELKGADREAILLRYFENRPLGEIAARLGVSENAARMRVDRALEKLRGLLARRGVTTVAAALSTAISANAVRIAPAGLAVTLTSASLAGAAAGTGTALTFLKLMTMTKLQTAIIGAIVVAGVATPLVIHKQAQVKSLADENAALRQRVNQLSPLIAVSERLSNLVAQADRPQSGSNDPSSELLRLRGEIRGLRSVADESAQLKAAEAQRASDPTASASDDLLAKVKFLKQRLDQNPADKIPELRYLSGKDWLRLTQDARLRDENPSDDQVLYALATVRSAAKQQLAYWMQPALRAYLQANGGQLPTDVTQLEPYFSQFNCPVDDATLERYQMLKTGNVNDLPLGASVIGEKAPVNDQYDTLWQIGLTNFVWQGTGKYRALMHGGWPPH